MKETYWGYWIIVLGIFVMGVMMLVNKTTTGTTQDYYALKEVTQASMVDAIDYSYYRLYGDIKMSKSKFIENFIRRFADTTTSVKNYNISFYDIYEVPPKVSVMVSSNTGDVNVSNNISNFDLVNKLDVILIGGIDPDKAITTGGGINYNVCKLDINVSAFLKYLETACTASNTASYPNVCALKGKQQVTKSEFAAAMTNDFSDIFANGSSAQFYNNPFLGSAANFNYNGAKAISVIN